MEKQALSLFFKALTGVFLFVLWFSVSGCQGSVEGKIYLDKNNNGLLDTDETGIPYAKMTVKYDGNPIISGYTDEDGYFKFRSRGNGSYSITLDETPEVEKINADLAASASMVKAITTVSPNTITNPTTPAPSTLDTTDTTETEKTKTEEVTTQAGPSGWRKDGDKYSYFVNVKGYKASLSIPVIVDHKGALTELVLPNKKERHPCEVFELALPLEEGCSLKPLYLLTGLELVSSAQPGVSYDSEISRLSFSSNVSDYLSSKAFKAQSISGGTAKPDIQLFHIPLKVACDVKDKTSFELEPQMECGSETIDLDPIKISIVKKEIEIKASIELDINPPTLTLGEDVVVRVTVRNKGSEDISNSYFTLVFSGIKLLKAPDEECSKQGSKLTCPIAPLKPNEKTMKPVILTLPVKLESDTDFTISATLKHDNLAKPIEAEAIEFTLEKNVQEQE